MSHAVCTIASIIVPEKFRFLPKDCTTMPRGPTSQILRLFLEPKLQICLALVARVQLTLKNLHQRLQRACYADTAFDENSKLTFS